MLLWQEMASSQITFRCKDCQTVACGSLIVRITQTTAIAGQAWTVKPRFFAECHIAGARGKDTSYRCAMCDGSLEAYRSRNELWARIEAYEVREPENEPDFIDGDDDLCRLGTLS